MGGETQGPDLEVFRSNLHERQRVLVIDDASMHPLNFEGPITKIEGTFITVLGGLQDGKHIHHTVDISKIFPPVQIKKY